MASAMSVFRKFQSSEGRVKVATLSGVSALVAVIALLVGVLPVMADHDGGHPLVDPGDPIRYGGGSGACDFVEVDSAAANELHDNKPTTKTLTGSDGTEIKIVVTAQTFSFEVLTPGIGVYDVVVNGGPHNNHYDYDGDLGEPVTYDEGLHAPTKSNGDAYNLSHVNICYDFNTQFECGVTETREQDGLFTLAEVTIFANSSHDCEDKLGAFFVDNEADKPSVTVNFGTGGDVTAGRADYTKGFSSPGDFAPLQYDGPGEFVELQWCETPAKYTTADEDRLVDGDEFDGVLANDKYPSLDGVKDTLNDGSIVDATACKVYEEEDATGTQSTVVYFEFEDPRFR